MKTTTLAAGVLVAAGLALGAARAEAGVRIGVGVVIGNAGHERGYPGPAAPRYGWDRGYREGAENGSRDARRGRRPEFWRCGDYRDADDGYHGWMGPRGAYEDAFRRGFEAGYRSAYREGYRGHGDWDRDGRRFEEAPRERW
jgi:hypothetical protein